MTKMKAVLEYGPLVVFLAAYALLKDQSLTRVLQWRVVSEVDL